MKYSLLYLSIFVLSSCYSNNADKSPVIDSSIKSLQKEASSLSVNHSDRVSILKNKQQEISGLIDLSCDNSSQCKIIGVGVSPCGGFSSYSVYSGKKTDIDQLKENVSQFNQIMRIENRKNKLVGICRHIEPPKFQCKQNRCSTIANSLIL